MNIFLKIYERVACLALWALNSNHISNSIYEFRGVWKFVVLIFTKIFALSKIINFYYVKHVQRASKKRVRMSRVVLMTLNFNTSNFIIHIFFTVFWIYIDDNSIVSTYHKALRRGLKMLLNASHAPCFLAVKNGTNIGTK